MSSKNSENTLGGLQQRDPGLDTVDAFGVATSAGRLGRASDALLQAGNLAASGAGMLLGDRVDGSKPAASAHLGAMAPELRGSGGMGGMGEGRLGGDSPALAHAPQLEGSAPALAHATQLAASTVTAKAPAMIDKLFLEEHPLAGQAINDFATAPAPFVPAPIDPANTAMVDMLLSRFTEGSRLLRFYSPLPAGRTLLIESLTGRAAMSEPFAFQLSLMSQNAAIDLKDLMGKNVAVSVRQADGSEHFINGYVNTFAATRSDGGFAFYHAEVVPWTTYLKRRVNSRIFQDMTVFEVMDTIFVGDYGGLARYECRTSKKYSSETYIVQYDETDEPFVSRLMEKYGLFYYFEHTASGHTMIVSDNSCDASFCPPQAGHAEVLFNGGNRWQDRDAVTALGAERHLQPNKVAMHTFDYKMPGSVQYVEMPTTANQGELPSMEVFDGSSAFAFKDREAGREEARLRMEVLEWQAKTFNGASDCRALTAGRTMKLLDHHWFDPTDGNDNDFLIVSVQYDARNNYFESDGKDVYRNSFTAIRRKIPYRPRRLHQAPRMPGPQTATVVGPKGCEIHTDSFGRIKVHFHWDRYGRHDQRSSCWLRVSQPWAGKGWGTISIPRVGQEVIIDYLDGNPDRPVCTGRLFNADQPAPYALPGGAHMMGFKSRSTPGGGGFSEMVIHDSKGSELINIHSQKDMVTTVQNTQATVVNGPHQTNSVTAGYHTSTVKQKIEMTSQTEHIGLTAQQFITLDAKTDHITQTAKTHIALKAETEHVDQTAKTHIAMTAETAHIAQTAQTHVAVEAKSAHITHTAKQHIVMESSAAHIHHKAKANIELTSSSEHIHLTASTDITLQVGASKIVMMADGTITIEGVNVNVIGSSRIDLNK
jgi:type VI secretion system secreted protein VgrG